MTEKTTLMEFPCDFPLKIIGKKTDQFANDIKETIKKHFPDTKDDVILYQESQKGNYLSITVTIHANNQSEIDALYRELTKHPDIKMVL